MTLELDDETREQLALRNPWEELLEGLEIKRTGKLTRDAVRMANLRTLAAVKLQEAKYQKAYAKTAAGHAARLRAQRAYRARRKAS